MKVVFEQKARIEFMALRTLARTDANAKELLKRLQMVIADMIQGTGINDSEIGKTKHEGAAIEGYLGGRLEGCIARNIDASNRLVACEINGVAVILCCIGHIGQYENQVLGLNEGKIRAARKELEMEIKYDSQVLADMENASQNIINSVHDADSALKLTTDRKSIYNRKEDIFSVNTVKIKSMMQNGAGDKALEQLPELLINLVNYSTCCALEKSGGDLHRLLENKQNYDRLINTFVIDLVQEVSSIQKGRESEEYMAHKELLINGILDIYADAYRNCLKFPVKPELYREDLDFINRLNEKMADAISNDTHEIMTVYGGSNGLTDLFSSGGAHPGTDRGKKHQASDPEEERIRKGGAHFVRITRVLGLGLNGIDPNHFAELLRQIDVRRLTAGDMEKKRQKAEEEREIQQVEEQQKAAEEKQRKEEEIQKRQEKSREQERSRGCCTREVKEDATGKLDFQAAQHQDDSNSAEEFYGEINDLAVNNIDTDRVYVKSLYKRQLDDLKVGHKVAYYIPEKNVVEFTENWSGCAPTANDVLKVWGSTVETAEDGIIPEDAVEVCFDKRYVHYINPEYRAHDLGRAIELATAIYQEKSIAEVRADLPVSVFTFADEESWDRCQAMIEMAISRNRKPPAGRNKEPPAGRNEDPPVR